MACKRFVIAAPRSGEGKTTISLGLMSALAQRALTVQGFKVGPDYIDPGFYQYCTDRPGRNLDIYMMSESEVLQCYEKHTINADVAVIEGVMGLFDGHVNPQQRTSTADTALLLKAPVLLVLDAKGAAASLAAIAYGFKHFDPAQQLCGVIINRWNPKRDRRTLLAAFERAQIPLLGFVPYSEESEIKSRHLGLMIAEEHQSPRESLQALGRLIAQHVDLDQILALATENNDRATYHSTTLPKTSKMSQPKKLIIAVARDAAFSFYYEDNLDLLQEMGASLCYFSPLTDHSLPPCDGLYLGGGYPESYLAILAQNRQLREDICAQIAAGLPTYAECGGYLFLCDSFTENNGNTYPLVGSIPGTVCLSQRLVGLGYREATTAADSIFGPAGTKLRGHEFHYSTVTTQNILTPAYTFDNGTSDGYISKSLLASYLHLHFAGCKHAVEQWIAACRTFQRRNL